MGDHGRIATDARHVVVAAWVRGHGGRFLDSVLIVKLDGMTGTEMWRRELRSERGIANCITITRTGELFVAGDFRGTMRAAGILLQTLNNDRAGFIARYTAEGGLLGARKLVGIPSTCTFDSENNIVYGGGINVLKESFRDGISWSAFLPASNGWLEVAVGPANEIYVVGSHAHAFVLSGSTEIEVAAPEDVWNLFLAKMSPGGRWSWARSYGGDGHEKARAIEATTRGTIWVLGEPGGVPTNVGGSILPVFGSDDVLLASYEAGSGDHRWSETYGSDENDKVYSLAAGPDGSVAIAGKLGGVADLGNGVFGQPNESTGFVAIYGP